jgi:hypothetical protein
MTHAQQEIQGILLPVSRACACALSCWTPRCDQMEDWLQTSHIVGRTGRSRRLTQKGHRCRETLNRSEAICSSREMQSTPALCRSVCAAHLEPLDALLPASACLSVPFSLNKKPLMVKDPLDSTCPKIVHHLELHLRDGPVMTHVENTSSLNKSSAGTRHCSQEGVAVYRCLPGSPRLDNVCPAG